MRNTATGRVLHIVYLTIGSKDKGVVRLNRVTGDGNGSDSSENNLLIGGPAADAVHYQNDVGTLGGVTQIDCRTVAEYVTATFNTPLILADGEAITLSLSKGGLDTCASILGYFVDA